MEKCKTDHKRLEKYGQTVAVLLSLLRLGALVGDVVT